MNGFGRPLGAAFATAALVCAWISTSGCQSARDAQPQPTGADRAPHLPHGAGVDASLERLASEATPEPAALLAQSQRDVDAILKARHATGLESSPSEVTSPPDTAAMPGGSASRPVIMWNDRNPPSEKVQAQSANGSHEAAAER